MKICSNNDANTNRDCNSNGDYACNTVNNLILSCDKYTSKYCTETIGKCMPWTGDGTMYSCTVDGNNYILKCEGA